jgi:hypothetical protein
MSALFAITEGWTGQLGPFTLKVDGVPLNLDGLTVTLSLRNASGAVVTPGGTVTKAPNQTTHPGQLYYKPVAGDFTFASGLYGPVQTYKMHWKVADGSGNVIYFPSGAPDDIEVHRA